MTFLANMWLNYHPVGIDPFPESFLSRLAPPPPLPQARPGPGGGKGAGAVGKGGSGRGGLGTVGKSGSKDGRSGELRGVKETKGGPGGEEKKAGRGLRSEAANERVGEAVASLDWSNEADPVVRPASLNKPVPCTLHLKTTQHPTPASYT